MLAGLYCPLLLQNEDSVCLSQPTAELLSGLKMALQAGVQKQNSAGNQNSREASESNNVRRAFHSYIPLDIFT